MLPALFLFATMVDTVRSYVAQHNFDAAERQVREYRTHSGVTPELAEAVSWIARGQLDAKNYPRADAYATETRKLSETLLQKRKLDAEPLLPIALGASIEVHAQTLAAQGARSEAVAFLGDQAKLFAGTSIVERIRKNLNLLSLEGKPAPELDEGEWLGSKPPSLASLRGHPVLLFFWAHWCTDCRAEAPLIADLQRIYGPKGLAVMGPTKLFGYAVNGEDAAPAVEKPYIDRVRLQFYGMLPNMRVPLSAANFQAYGASTVPTIVLIDSAGIVRLYHPGVMPEAELAARIQAVLRK
jgi:cytochrome c biogenesis protein CcmG/thiol:disulfide interchange protein DsbE